MESSDHGLVSIEVERIAYAAIGRHLRVMCFLCLLLLVLGFLIGHHVANQHARNLARDLEHREDALRAELATLTGDVAALQTAGLEERQRVADLQGQIARHELAMTEARQAIEASQTLRQSLIVDAIEQVESDRRGVLRELQPYEEQNRPLPPHVVSGALSRVVEAQRERLNRLIDAPAVTAARNHCPADQASALPLVPVSESGPSPTIAPASGATTADTSPAVASDDILLFETPAKIEAPAPPPPAETSIFTKPAAPFAPQSSGDSVGFTPAPIPAPAPATPAMESAAATTAGASSAVPATIPAAGFIESVPLQELHGHGAVPLNPDARRSRTTLFFSPARKPPANSVPAIPITAPAATTGPTQATAGPTARIR